MIWSKEETLSREDMQALQLERLKETVTRVYERVLPYRKKMDDAGVKPEDIKSLIKKAQNAYDKAIECQKEGDWEGYGKYIKQLERYLTELSNQ